MPIVCSTSFLSHTYLVCPSACVSLCANTPYLMILQLSNKGSQSLTPNRNPNIENSTNTDKNDPRNTNHGQINGQVNLSGTNDDDSAHVLSDNPLMQHTHMTNGHSGGDGSLSLNETGPDGGLDGNGMGMSNSQGFSKSDQEYYCNGFNQDLRHVKVCVHYIWPILSIFLEGLFLDQVVMIGIVVQFLHCLFDPLVLVYIHFTGA